MLRVKTIYKKIRKNLSYLKTAIRFRNLNYIFYNTLKDLNLNKKLFKEKNYDLKFVNKILNQNNIDFHSPETSWHYHIFAALSKNHKRLKILEIGTSKGEFSNFLSKIFNDSEIITIDLSEKHRKHFH